MQATIILLNKKVESVPCGCGEGKASRAEWLGWSQFIGPGPGGSISSAPSLRLRLLKGQWDIPATDQSHWERHDMCV